MVEEAELLLYEVEHEWVEHLPLDGLLRITKLEDTRAQGRVNDLVLVCDIVVTREN